MHTDTHELIRRAELVKEQLIAGGIWEESSKLRDYDAALFREWMLTLEQLPSIVGRLENALEIKPVHKINGKVKAMVCGCPHCKAFIPASTPGGLCSACGAHCEKHLNSIAQAHASPTILPKPAKASQERMLSEIKEILDANPCHHLARGGNADPDCVHCDVQRVIQTSDLT